MSFWSSQRLREQRRLYYPDLIRPFNPDCVQQGAYELSLSDEVLTTPLAIKDRRPIEGDTLMIHPGQFGLLYTTERVQIPANVIAFISIKASKKLDGLVNISGFHVDPGYSGRLKFSVYNAGTQTIPLQFGKPAFLIWFCDLDQATEDPYGYPHHHVDQKGIAPDERVRMSEPVPSPTALDERVQILEARWRTLMRFGKYVLLPLLVSVVGGVVLWVLTTVLPSARQSGARDSKLHNANTNAAPERVP
jgi:dCTP deaminase